MLARYNVIHNFQEWECMQNMHVRYPVDIHNNNNRHGSDYYYTLKDWHLDAYYDKPLCHMQSTSLPHPSLSKPFSTTILIFVIIHYLFRVLCGWLKAGVIPFIGRVITAIISTRNQV